MNARIGETIHIVNGKQLCDEQYAKYREDLGYTAGKKAGEEVERKRWVEKDKILYCEKHNLYYCDCCPDCFEEKGRKEVVEWIQYHLPSYEFGDAWQAKLKEWGIKE